MNEILMFTLFDFFAVIVMYGLYEFMTMFFLKNEDFKENTKLELFVFKYRILELLYTVALFILIFINVDFFHESDNTIVSINLMIIVNVFALLVLSKSFFKIKIEREEILSK